MSGKFLVLFINFFFMEQIILQNDDYRFRQYFYYVWMIGLTYVLASDQSQFNISLHLLAISQLLYKAGVVRYGQCVYKCDNDVCDSQVVNVLFQGGTVANLTMTAFTKEVPQKVDIYLTRTKCWVDVWCGSECHVVGLRVDVTSRYRVDSGNVVGLT